MTDYSSLLFDLKTYREAFADQLADDMTPQTTRRLAETQMAILAVEALALEPEQRPTGPRIEFGPDGWPKP